MKDSSLSYWPETYVQKPQNKLLCWCLDVGLDALEVLLVVHLRPRISDNANILGEEVVAMLRFVNSEPVGY
jgi:hypothetical protein